MYEFQYDRAWMQLDYTTASQLQRASVPHSQHETTASLGKYFTEVFP